MYLNCIELIYFRYYKDNNMSIVIGLEDMDGTMMILNRFTIKEKKNVEHFITILYL